MTDPLQSFKCLDCRYFEGNRRAKKRVERTRAIISEIGLEPERVGIIFGSKEEPKTLAELVELAFERIGLLEPSPVFGKVGGR